MAIDIVLLRRYTLFSEHLLFDVSNVDFRTHITHFVDNRMTFIRLLKFAIQKSHVQSNQKNRVDFPHATISIQKGQKWTTDYHLQW